MGYKFEERLDWRKLATFVPNKKIPVYNWFYYKEGYARELVMKIIELFGLGEGSWVLDPFCGSGTTLLACKERGINSIGFDTSPLCVFASRVKCGNYEGEELKEGVKYIMKQKFVRPKVEAPDLIMRAFSRYALEDLIFFREKISQVENRRVREFLLLGLLNAALKASWAWKDGAVIKIKKRSTPPLRKILFRVLKKMVRDIENFEVRECETQVQIGDARMLPLQNETIDAVITSPPYLNQIDYLRAYEIENWIIGKTPQPGMRSLIGAGKGEEFLEEEIPQQARPYLKDMQKAVSEMHRVCKKEGRAAIVVGNAYFPEGIVEVDEWIAKFGEEVGFSVNKIVVLNKRAALVGRTRKVGELRESLVLLEKD